MWEMVMQVLSRMLFMVLHVVNSGSFPKPLTAAQEREAFAAMRAGDRAARQTLIEHNLRLVAHIIKKYYAGAQNQEDLVSIGTIGLIKAVDTFDETKGPRLATYAARCIENATLPPMRFRSIGGHPFSQAIFCLIVSILNGIKVIFLIRVNRRC